MTFEDIILNATDNPVIIDQHYKPGLDRLAPEVVKVSDVTFRNILEHQLL